MRADIPKSALDACVGAADQSLYTCRSLIEHLKSDSQLLKELAEAPKIADGDQADVSKANAYLMANVVSYGREINRLEKRAEFLERRLDHAVRALRRKHLYAESAEELLAICEDMGLDKDRAVLQMIRCTMGESIMTVGGTGELDENSWKVGLDLAMLECEPELAASDDLYAPVLERHAGRIFADVMMSAYASKLSQLLATDNYKSAIEQPLMEKYMLDEGFRNRFSDTIASAIASAMKTLDGEDRDRAAPDPEKLKSDLEAARAEIAALKNAESRAVAPVQARADRLEQRLRDLEAENAALKAENEDMYGALEARDRKLSDRASGDRDDGDLPDLPESGVVFVGGHPNMLKKLRKDHPGWTFIGSGDKTADLPAGPSMIFFYDQHLSHPVYHKIRKAAGPSVPKAYLKATNLDMLDAEMRRAWAGAGE